MHKYFSQSGEDYLLWQTFEHKAQGFYVDIGAFDGIHLSNSFSFELAGWNGICVEPHPRYYPLCKHNRRNATCLNNACVGDKDTLEVEFLCEELGLLSGIDPDSKMVIESRYKARGMPFQGFEKVNVPATTLDMILGSEPAIPRTIDFISIDTEGTEIDILRPFPFDKWDVKVFIIEANTDTAKSELTKLMRSAGYELIRELRPNLFFAKLHKYNTDILRWSGIDCPVENTLHPLGEHATPIAFRGRHIRNDPQWITPSVLCQHPDQPLGMLAKSFPRLTQPIDTAEIKIAHIINVFSRPGDATHKRIMQLTLDSLIQARNLDQGPIQLIGVMQHDDHVDLPEDFSIVPSLTRTASDINSFQQQASLPLLFDILDSGIQKAHGAEYVVFSNLDICLVPNFYLAVRELIGFGFDALTINRRLLNISLLETNASASLHLGDYGIPHAGFDCFVFRKEAYKNFIRNNACIGKGAVMRGLLYNMVAHSNKLLMLKNCHLTYHFGNDEPWRDSITSEYWKYNLNESYKVLKELCCNDTKRARLEGFCVKHKEPLHPSHEFPY
ncbi:methyltransferase, FkbM family [Desulfocurvibacter africanus PCS]|uniref:Methyltransferase, FkbM family n=1 Tax=Desulfocurvibacter africanus PCS TaxID=1262666 RepID=M5Q0M5_DESAF|nr:FkbM family methyltransferase [Desulfocurvibacter africanus]EMG36826.1 methyltransferase, FkbM family [Desulfocurvibacter africanus PCS]